MKLVDRGEELAQQAEVLLHERDLGSALEAFNDAQFRGADPDRCGAGRWMVHMLRGDFESTWLESDAIRARGAPDPHRFWQGEDLHGKRITVRCLHGLGDAVQLLRYAPGLRALAASVVFEVPPQLVPLAPHFEGVDGVITWGAGAPAQSIEWDVQIEANELPYVFRTQAHDLPWSVDYLQLPADICRCATAKPHEPQSLRVGVVWASGDWKPSRSMPLHVLRPLLQTPGCEFWNLQGGSARDQWATLGPATNLHSAEECADSLLNLAATIAQLDLVITTDTLAAHLAGAQGIPAWVMLERAANWRWQHQREDSPWYPSLRLLRQPAHGDWQSVVSSAGRLLTSHAGSREPWAA